MTFEARESSLHEGQPIRLYEFRRGVTMRWRYTNADRDISHMLESWQAVTITDDGIRQTGETSADEIVITVPHNLAIAQLYRGVPPSDEIGVILRDAHFDEPESHVAWQGTIVNVGWPGEERAEIRCEPLSGSMARPGLRLGYERGCPYAVYDLHCGLDPLDWRISDEVTVVDGVTIAADAWDALPDGWFDGGYIEWPIGPAEVERRGISRHEGATLRLLRGTHGLADGMTVHAHPGCARTVLVCHNKFGNLPQYGGFPHLPGKSPFDGDPVF